MLHLISRPSAVELSLTQTTNSRLTVCDFSGSPVHNFKPKQQPLPNKQTSTSTTTKSGMPKRSRSLVDDARQDRQRNRVLLDEIRSEVQRQQSILDEELEFSQPAKQPMQQVVCVPVTEQQQQQQQEVDQDNNNKAPIGEPQSAVQLAERCLVDFPRHISELDHCNHLLIKYEPELDPTHPGFHDPEYRARRKQVAEVAFNYKHGERIPEIDYNSKELDTWRFIYLRLKEAYSKYACRQHLRALEELEASPQAQYGPDRIPQLQQVSEFLEQKTGWRLRPVAGLLSARDFLASLAFRVFQTTQYLRHWGNPEHSVEPDCIHELMGHIPMLCDPEFAQFSQELGLASLGASDEQIEKFATLYWFTVEFGLCKEEGQLKCYGAGLLSSYGEMEHALESGRAHLKEFVPEETAVEQYDDAEYQVVYYVASSFDDAKAKIKAYAQAHLERDFELAYDPFSNSIRQLDSLDELNAFAQQVRNDVARLSVAINKLKMHEASSNTKAKKPEQQSELIVSCN